ncbi:MAG: MBL fold metallo-hydrolase [Bacteroidales bacterium]|nr:MBL fold metallo-hydrolase [Bacteroidales bacterium]MBR5054593.1 MBL fold metallo-hydrolase [Bacteroidales bacterium]
MNEKMQAIIDTKVENGTVAMWWLGQMGLIVKSASTMIVIDYYATPLPTRQVTPPIPADELTGVDAFLGTHNHIDHIDHPAWRIWANTNPEAKFVFPRAHKRSISNDKIADSNAVGLNAGESVQIGDMTIHAIAASHEFLDQDKETGLFPHLQYIVECNGVRIHHAGDTVRYEGMMPAIKAFGAIDVELIPINGRDARRLRRNCIGNMTYQEAADLAGDVEPKLVIPGHWDMFADNSADPTLFEEYIKTKYKDRLTCRIPKVLEKIVVKA